MELRSRQGRAGAVQYNDVLAKFKLKLKQLKTLIEHCKFSSGLLFVKEHRPNVQRLGTKCYVILRTNVWGGKESKSLKEMFSTFSEGGGELWYDFHLIPCAGALILKQSIALYVLK